MRRALGAAWLAIAVGCGGGGSTGTESVDLSGLWNYHQSTATSDVTQPVRCGEVGQLDITQSGVTLNGRITGRGGCQGPTGAFDYVVSGTLSQARVAEGQIVFQAADCRYQGTYGDTQGSGTLTCQDTHTATPFTHLGTWEMTRVSR